MNSLTDREKRLIALGLLAAVVALVWFTVVSPILGGFAERGEARSKALAEQRHNALLIASSGALRRQVEAQRQLASVYALNAPSAAIAFEMARDRVAKAATSRGGLVQAIRMQPGPAREVRLQADVRIGLAGLTDLTRSLEDDRPYASVDKLFITAPDAPGASGSSPLEVRLEVSYSYVGGG